MKEKDMRKGLHIEHPNLINKDVYFTSSALEKSMYPNKVVFNDVNRALLEMYMTNFLDEYDVKVNMILCDYYKGNISFSLAENKKIDKKRLEKRVRGIIEAQSKNKSYDLSQVDTMTFKDVISRLFVHYWDIDFRLGTLNHILNEKQRYFKKMGYQFQDLYYDKDQLMVRLQNTATGKMFVAPYNGSFEKRNSDFENTCLDMVDHILKPEYQQLQDWKSSLKGKEPIVVVDQKNRVYNFYIDGENSYLEDCLISGEQDAISNQQSKKITSLKPFFHSNFWLPKYFAMNQLRMSLNSYRIPTSYLPETLVNEEEKQEKNQNPTKQLKNNSK